MGAWRLVCVGDCGVRATSGLRRKETPISNRDLDPSPGGLTYVLGLVVVASRPNRFWLGFTRALAPIVVGRTPQCAQPMNAVSFPSSEFMG